MSPVEQEALRLFQQLDNKALDGRSVLKFKSTTKLLASEVECHLTREPFHERVCYKVVVFHRGIMYKNIGYRDKNIIKGYLCEFLSGLYRRCLPSEWI